MAPPDVAPAPITVWISSMKRTAFGCASISLTTCFQPLLEVAPVARAREQRAHVEREHDRVLEHLGHLAAHDLARETLGDGRLADARIADQQWVVLLPATQDLDRALHLVFAADKGVDLALAGLLVEVDAVGVQGFALLLLPGLVLTRGPLVRLLLRPARGPRFTEPGPLRDAVADVVDGVVAGHLLLLQEVGRMAFPLGEDRDKHVRAL
jgi:hypothetical protein